MNNVEIRGLKKSFGSTPVLQGLDLDLQAGKIIGLLGPNGEGKSTLIKLINGLLRPDGGSIVLFGHQPDHTAKARISYLPERTSLNRRWSVQEVLRRYQDYFADFDKDRALELLRQLGLDPNMKLSAMSKGMQEKVQLVLAMSRKADLYILDEPLSGVDPAARQYILQTILTSFEPTSSILLSTHLIGDVEPVLDEVIFLKEGKVLLHEDAEALRSRRNQSVEEAFKEEFAWRPDC